MTALFALGIIGAAAGLLVLLTILRRRSPAVLRRIQAYERLNHEVARSIENGTRLHISLGRGNLFTPRGGSALAGLAVVRRIAERTTASDRTPIVTSGDASITILSQDSAKSGYAVSGMEDQFRLQTGRVTGFSPFTYAAGAIAVTRDENISANIVIGDLGAESALLAEAADRQASGLIAASDNLSAQSILLASSQEPLIAEELFAAGAYLGAGASHEASLQVQDILRWTVILAILAGAAFKFLGLNF